MLFSELAGLPVKELNKKKADLRTKLFEARMKNSLGQLANPMVIREARRDIARINTALAKQVTAAPKTAAKAPAKKAAKPAARKSAVKKTSKAKKG